MQRKARREWAEAMQRVREPLPEEESTVKIRAQAPYPFPYFQSFVVSLTRTVPIWVLSEARRPFTAESPKWASQTRSSMKLLRE